MKKTVIIFATLLFCFYLHAQQAGNDFYYYFGEKIFLTERADKMFIKLTENADTQSLLALMQADESICLDALNKQTFDLFVILETKNGESFSLGTVNKFRENPNIISTQLMLEYESDQLLAPTNEFTVKLKPATSFGQLQNLVTEHGCIIVRESQFVENQYIISIDVVETYLKENNYKEAMITLTKMYERFEITEEQAFELNDLGTYIHWLLQLEAEENSIYTLSENEINYLIYCVETHTGRSRTFAKIILCELYEICIEDEEAEGGKGYAAGSGADESEKQKTESTKSSSNIEELNGDTKWRNLYENITIHPNPTTGELTITTAGYHISNIEIYNVYGKKLSSYYPITPSSRHKVDISYLNFGIYFVRVTTEADEIVKKIIKQ